MLSVLNPVFGAAESKAEGEAAGTGVPADIEGHWAKALLTEWLADGKIQGYPDGTFKPDKSVTRGEFAALVNRSFGFREKAEIAFNDLKPSDWAFGDIAIAVKAGYLEGYDDGTVGSDQSITRQEAAVIAARLLGLDTAGSASGFEAFGDAGQMAAWSRGSIAAVAAIGVMEGYETGRFEPEAEITRAEAVVTLDRASSAERKGTTVYDKSGTYGPADEPITVKGDVMIAVEGVTLRNMIITGDLLLAEGIGEGDAFLTNVTVKGTTTIKAGGANSVHLEDSTFVTVVIDKAAGTVRVVAEGATTIAEVVLNSSAIVDTTGLTGEGLLRALLSENMPKDARVKLSGGFEHVTIAAASVSVEVVQGKIKELTISRQAAGVTLQLSKEAAIVSLIVDAVASITGQGGIETATISEYAKGTRFERQPDKMKGAGAPTSSPAATTDPGVTTPTPAPTATATPTPAPTATATPTPAPTATATPTPAPTATATPTPAPTATATPSPTPTATTEPTPTQKPAALLVKNGVPNADILIGSSAGGLEQYAATELQSVISMISGAELPIVRGDIGSETVSAALSNSAMNIGKSGSYSFRIDLVNNSGKKAQVNFTQLGGDPLTIDPLNEIELAVDEAAGVNGTLHVPWNAADGTHNVIIQATVDGIALDPLTLTVQLDRNVIYNPDFEAANLDGWWAPAGVGVWDGGVSHGGGHSMRMDMVAAGYTYSRTDRELHLEPGQEYVLQAWMKGEKAGKATVEFRELKNGVGDIPGGSAKHTVAVGEDWTLVEVRYTRNPEHDFDFNWINFWSFSQSGEGTGKLWIDDVTLRAVEKAPLSAKLLDSMLNVKRSGDYPFRIDVANNREQPVNVSFAQTDSGPLFVQPIAGIELAGNESRTVTGTLRVPASVTDGTYTATLLASADGIALDPLTLSVQLDRNVIYNPDFEAANLDGWWAPAGVGVWDSSVSHGGGHSMRMDMVAAGYTYSRTDRELHLEPGQEYVLQAWMKGEKAGKATVEFRELKNGVGDIPGGSAKHTVAVGEDWTLVEVRYTRNPDHDFDFNWINFWSFSQAAEGTGKLWIDDVTLRAVEEEEQEASAESKKVSVLSNEAESGEERIRIILATPESYAGLSDRYADDLAFLQGSDGFAVRKSGNRIYIIGSEPRGVLNGIYDFLEKNTGILWTRSTDVGSIYEPASTIKADKTDYREKSPFQVRGWHTTGTGVTGVPKYDFGTMEMLTRNKLNAKFAEFENLSYWGEHESMGIKAVNLGHNLGFWLPNEEFFASHPEYYNWENGGYVPVSHKTQINFYNPDVPGVIAEKVKQFHSVHGTQYIGIGINDNHSFTQSEESRQPFTTPDGVVVQPDDPAYKSTVFFTFLNKVAAEVKKTYPDVRIVSYAYFFTETPPKVELEDNILIVMAPASEDERIPLNTSDTESNNYGYKVLLEQWAQKTKNVVMYNYYGCCYPASYERPIAEKVQADMQFYRDLGIMGVLPEGVLDAGDQAWGVNALQFWLFHKLFWNPDADLEALKNEFIQKAYGAAAEPMKRYYELIEQGWNFDRQPINWYSNESQLIGQYIIAAGIKDEARSALDEAWGLAEGQAKARIEPIRSTFNQMVFLYGELPNLSANAVKTTATKEEILQSLDFSTGPWVNAEPVTTFLVMKSMKPVPVETKVYLLWDDENLYVGYESFDDDQEGMIVSDAPNGWWSSGADDSVETHLSGGQGSTTYAFFTNPDAVKFVYKTGPTFSPTTQFEVSAQRKSDRWNVIQAIPFASFGFDPKASSTFEALFFRNYHGNKGLFGWGGGTVWSPADQSPVHLIE
ncbi:DUF4838 domain-containing protein [Paenibacillus contaminans]|nr:DUF4838 domain-containing protein [Paenibacillus contaminans]